MTTEIIWYGHAAIGVKSDGHFVLVDPYFTGNATASTKAESLSPNFILVTHGHSDHLGDTVAIAKRTGAMVISNTEICAWLSKREVKTHGMQIGGGYSFPFGYLKFTLALHGSRMPDDSYGGTSCGFILTTPEKLKIYMAGDTGLFGDMQLIGEEGIDLAFLPIGDHYTMGPDDALRVVGVAAAGQRHIGQNPGGQADGEEEEQAELRAEGEGQGQRPDGRGKATRIMPPAEARDQHGKGSEIEQDKRQHVAGGKRREKQGGGKARAEGDGEDRSHVV